MRLPIQAARRTSSTWNGVGCSLSKATDLWSRRPGSYWTAKRQGTPSAEKLSQTGVLVVTCPTTGKDFSTGILTDAASLTLTPNELIHSHCPHCDVEHAWRTTDAKLVAALPPSKWVEFARAEVAKTNFDQKMMFQAAVKHVAAR